MKKKILPLVALALGIAVGAAAQEKDSKAGKIRKEKETDVIIRKKGDGKEKTTIVIDGNDITVNGKPIDELKETDVEILRRNGFDAIAPRISGRVMPMLGGAKMFGGDISLNKAFLGVTTNASDKGAKVVSVQKESPAEKAGLKKDDIITKVNDTKIESSSDLYDAIGEYKPDDKVTVTYLRDDKQQTATITLEKNKNTSITLNGDFGNGFNRNFDFDMPQLRNLPRINGMEFSTGRKPRLGVEIQDLEEGKGVKVLDVDEETPAAKAGLRKDDIITAIDGKSIDSVDELQSTIRGMKEGDSFMLSYKRNGQSQTAEIRFPKKLKTADL